MRISLALLAAVFCLTEAIAANDAEKPAAHSAPEASSHKQPAKEEPKKEEPKKEVLKGKAAAEAREAKEAMGAQELAAKVKARMLAMQKTRATKHEHGKTDATPVAHGAHWSYEGEGGPARWGKLDSAWAKCDTGNRQSPIDIRDGIKVDLETISFDYQPSTFNVVDNGHTVQVNLGSGNRIVVMGRIYELIQFHFHRPSEERIEGRGFDMVVHLVHRDANGRLAVVAVLIEGGKPHPLIQTVWNNLPLEKNEPVAPNLMMDVSKLLPEHREYYTYMGSLTTPPCSEGVLWMVLKEPIQASAQQIGIFGKLYQMNARPIQSSAGRLIKESN